MFKLKMRRQKRRQEKKDRNWCKFSFLLLLRYRHFEEYAEKKDLTIDSLSYHAFEDKDDKVQLVYLVKATCFHVSLWKRKNKSDKKPFFEREFCCFFSFVLFSKTIGITFSHECKKRCSN